MAHNPLPPNLNPTPTAEGLIRNAVTRSENLSDAGPEIARVSRGFGVIIGRSWASAETSADVLFAEEAGAAVMDIGFGTLALLFLAVVIFAYWLVHFERWALSKVPMVGDHLKHIADGQIAVLDPVVSWIVRQADETLSMVLHAFVTLVTWSIAVSGKVKQTVLDGLIQSYVSPIKDEADTLWAWLQHESTRITNIYNEVHGAHNVPSDHSIPLHQQVHQLQHQIQVIEAAMNGYRIEVSGLRAEVASIWPFLNQLSASLHGVHNVDVGWSDVSSSIAQTQQNVTQLGSTLAPQVGHNSAMLELLAPLGMLLQPGARGLENLRNLEDDPCQCPRIGLGGSDIYAKLLALKHELKGD